MAIPEESKISKTLSDKTTKIVVILVLFLLFMLAFCSTDAYVENTLVFEQGLKNLVAIYDLGEEYYPNYAVAYDFFVNSTID